MELKIKYQTEKPKLDKLDRLAWIIQLCEMKIECLEKSCTSSIYNFGEKQKMRTEVEKRKKAVNNLQKHYAERVFEYAGHIYERVTMSE